MPHQPRLQKNLWAILFCTALAAAVMAICTRCSPLYPMNTWVDVNCFHTMGRAVLDGKVLYRDIYEQKGPLLYFIYALLAGLTPRSYLGAYLMECVCFSGYLYYSGKCAGLYVKRAWPVCFILPLLAAAVGTSEAFAMGGSVEEMCLFPAICSLYLILRAVQEKKPIPGQDAFLIGLFASAAFWIKYTLCGLYAGLALFVALYYWLGLRQPKRLPAVIGWFLLGLTPVTAAILLYFIVNGALGDLFWAYFYNNIFLYSSAAGSSLFTVVYNVAWYTYVTLWHNRLYMGLAALGVLWFLAGIKTRLWETLAACIGYGLLVFFVFAGGVYSAYYGLYFAMFSVFGLIALVRLGQRLAEKLPWRFPSAAAAALCAAVLAGSLLYTYRHRYWRTEKQSLVQYQFAQIIGREPDATLLNYGFLDGGFYFAADLVPNVKYFCRLNVPLPEMWSEQDRYVREAVTDFVVVDSRAREEFLAVMQGYHLAAESGDSSFQLYQRDE